jgi:hypothetical protein
LTSFARQFEQYFPTVRPFASSRVRRQPSHYESFAFSRLWTAASHLASARLRRGLILAEKEWQTLCESIAKERDPERRSILLDRLHKTMELRRQARRLLREKLDRPGPVPDSSGEQRPAK